MKSKLKITNLSFIKETHSQEEKNIKGGGAGDIFDRGPLTQPAPTLDVNPDIQQNIQDQGADGFTDALGFFQIGNPDPSIGTFPDVIGASPTIL